MKNVRIFGMFLIGLILPATAAYCQEFNIDLVGHYGAPAEVLFVTGESAYVGYGSWLSKIDVSDPADPRLVSRIWKNRIIDLCAENDFAYVLQEETSFQVIDFTDPAEPESRGSLNTGPARQITMDNGLLYYIDRNGLQIVDASNPDEPVIVGKRDISGTPSHLFVKNGTAFVTRYVPHSTVILDVGNPAEIQEVGSFSSVPGAVILDATKAYEADYMIQIFDVSDYGNVKFLNAIPLGVGPIALNADSLYVTSAIGLSMFDVTDSKSPMYEGFYHTPISPTDTATANGLVYVCGGQGGLWILRYTGKDTASPNDADINKDGAVNDKDQLLLMNNWHQSGLD